MLKILITGSGYSERHFSDLKLKGFEIKHCPEDMSPHAVRGLIPEFDAYVLGGNERLTESELAVARKLKVISFVGTGYGTFIEEGAARKRNITIRTTPAVMAPAVVEHTMGMILGMRRKLFEQNRRVKESAITPCTTQELSSACVGIVGMGAIGSRLARLLKTGFGANIVYQSRTRKKELELELDIEPVALDELFRRADIIVLALPTAPDTEAFVNSELLSLVKYGTVLINTAGARLVDPKSLKESLESGRLAGAAFDGYFEEPLPGVNSDRFGFLSMLDSKFIITPHTAARTEQSWTRMVDMAIDNVVDFPFE